MRLRTCKQLLSIMLCVTVVAVALANSAKATNLTINPVVVAAYTDGTFGVALPDIPDLGVLGTPRHLQVDFQLTLSGLSGTDAGFGNTAFDILLGPGMTDAFGWAPTTEMVPLPPPGPTGDQPLFADNGDFGTNGDLIDIVNGIVVGVTNAADPRRRIGQDGPTTSGSLFVSWDGVAASTLSTNVKGFFAVLADGTLAASDNPVLTGGMIALGGTAGGDVPVVQVVDLGERHWADGVIIADLMADNGPITNWSSLTPSTGTPFNAATLGGTNNGTFSWNPAGSPAGPIGNGVLYEWTAVATNADGDSLPGVAIRLTLVPEPATLALVGLAMVGFVGVFRRRG
jgi:hypothetical protein